MFAVTRVAPAHQQGVSYSEIEVGGGRIRYDLTISNHDLQQLDANRDGEISADEVVAGYPTLRRQFRRTLGVAVGGTPCPLTLEDFLSDPSGAVVFRLRGPCAEGTPLHVVYGVLAEGGSPGYNLAKVRFRGALIEHVFTRNDTELMVGADGAGLAATLWRFFRLGVEHIATGYDHVLFLLALLLVGGGVRSLAAIVTAFTVAHSITLALATLDVVTLPSRLVEAAIALSIAWVALENLVLERPQGRWRITFVFGLVHGFGFATILRGMHLPTEGLVASLLAFNLGVEAGQLAIVLAAAPVLRLLARTRHRRVMVAGASALILVVALYWLAERTFAS